MFSWFVNVKVPVVRILLSQESVWVKEAPGQGWGGWGWELLELQIVNSLEKRGQSSTPQRVPGGPLGLLPKATSQLSAQPLPSVSPAAVEPEISLHATSCPFPALTV